MVQCQVQARHLLPLPDPPAPATNHFAAPFLSTIIVS